MRLLLCAVLFLSAGWIGIQHSTEYRNRPLRLERLADSLTVLQTEICNRKTPLPEALLRCSNSFKELNSFFQMLYIGLKTDQSFSNVWSHATARLYTESAEVQYALRSLGNQIGKYDAQTQEKAFRTSIDVLRNHASEIGLSSKESAKLAIGFGAVVGLLLAIVCY